MPIVSEFYGITVTMHTETNERHNIPHVHAQYQDNKIVMSFDGNVLAGKFRTRQLRMMQEWISEHEKELEDDWVIAQSGQKIFRIDPYKAR